MDNSTLSFLEPLWPVAIALALFAGLLMFGPVSRRILYETIRHPFKRSVILLDENGAVIDSNQTAVVPERRIDEQPEDSDDSFDPVPVGTRN
jgi:hypothetical protein